MPRITVEDIRKMKHTGEKIAMLTAYDFATAKVLDEAGIPMILVGDSLGMVVLGYDSTLPVTVEDMIHHTKAVVRGTRHGLVVIDMPFMSYQASIEDAMRNAGRMLKETNCQAVKLEGGDRVADTVRHMVDAGIPVMGHIGLTPQSVNQLGGYKVQGRTPQAAIDLIKSAKALEQAGAFGIVLEAVPAPLSKIITESVSIPTIGIGAGPDCDGQVQVLYDMLGLFTDFVPKHAKQYAKIAPEITRAVRHYIDEVKGSTFPTAKESHGISEEALKEIQAFVRR